MDMSGAQRPPTRISRMKPLGVQEWLKKMDAAPKTKGRVKALLHRLY
jgi:integrase